MNPDYISLLGLFGFIFPGTQLGIHQNIHHLAFSLYEILQEALLNLACIETQATQESDRGSSHLSRSGLSAQKC